MSLCQKMTILKAILCFNRENGENNQSSTDAIVLVVLCFVHGYWDENVIHLREGGAFVITAFHRNCILPDYVMIEGSRLTRGPFSYFATAVCIITASPSNGYSDRPLNPHKPISPSLYPKLIFRSLKNPCCQQNSLQKLLIELSNCINVQSPLQ